MNKHPDVPDSVTHQATLTIFSNEDQPDVWIQIDWEPKLTGGEMRELGYFPASYRFIQENVVPMLEQAFAESLDELANADSPSELVN